MDPLETQLQRQLEQSRDFFWHRLRWKAVAGLLPRGDRFQLLDVGAGPGLIGEYLRRDRPAARYRFIEPIESLRRHLEQRFGVDANAGDMGSVGDMDVVTLLDVLEHQVDDGAFLADIVGRMRPGATLIMTVPALPRLWSAWDVALGHERRYVRPSLREVIASSHGRVQEISYLFPELVPAALLRRMRQPAGRVHLTAAEEYQFPELPRWLNGLLYAVGSATLAARRVWPFGTSLLAVVRRPDRAARP